MSMEEAIDSKVRDLEALLVDADALRLGTLRSILEVFTTVQSAQYLVAAAELVMAVRKVGMSKQAAYAEERRFTTSSPPERPLSQPPPSPPSAPLEVPSPVA
eukprot:SM000058S18523  [mRNA]  locus=s58:286526:286945:- [translate_table: standard]